MGWGRSHADRERARTGVMEEGTTPSPTVPPNNQQNKIRVKRCERRARDFGTGSSQRLAGRFACRANALGATIASRWKSCDRDAALYEAPSARLRAMPSGGKNGSQ